MSCSEMLGGAGGGRVRGGAERPGKRSVMGRFGRGMVTIADTVRVGFLAGFSSLRKWGVKLEQGE